MMECACARRTLQLPTTYIYLRSGVINICYGRNPKYMDQLLRDLQYKSYIKDVAIADPSCADPGILGELLGHEIVPESPRIPFATFKENR